MRNVGTLQRRRAGGRDLHAVADLVPTRDATFNTSPELREPGPRRLRPGAENTCENPGTWPYQYREVTVRSSYFDPSPLNGSCRLCSWGAAPVDQHQHSTPIGGLPCASPT
jgi:hypothetical protein